jgi:hypothetical protein
MNRNTGRLWVFGSIALLVAGSILLVSFLTNAQPLFERARFELYFELYEDRPAGEQVMLSLPGGEELDMHTYYLQSHE